MTRFPTTLSLIGSLRGYDGCCNENVTFRKNSVALGLELFDHFMLVKLYKIGEVHFRLLRTRMVLMLRQRTKDILLRVRVVVRPSNLNISCHRFADYIKNSASKSVPHVQQD